MNTDVARIARTKAREIELPSLLFDYSIGWALNYTDIFSGETLEPGGVESILRMAAASGRVLLCGRAGSGKSLIVRRLAKSIAGSKRDMPILVNLSKWSSRDSEDAMSRVGDSVSLMNLVLARCSGLDVSILELDVISPTLVKTIIVDGLNEIPASLGNSILRALDDTVTRLINCRVVVTDRLTRRQITETRWRLGRVEPLSEEAVGKVVARAGNSLRRRIQHTGQQLLEWPFFLAKVLADDTNSGASGTDTLRQFFENRVQLTSDEMDTTAAAAYQAYVGSSSRTFSALLFIARVGDQVFGKLTQAGSVELSGDVARFTHHLQHDFLAARHVASDVALWRYAGFNTLTFQASSFDAIALAFAQVTNPQKASFVRRVYDWNPYAIAYALAEDEYREPADLEQELELVVLAMLAEKRWDPVIPSAERATDALNLFPRLKAQAFLAADSLEVVIDFVRGLQSEVPWFVEWQKLFCLPQHVTPDDHAVARLSDDDSIIGWTLANVLRRVTLNNEQLTCVFELGHYLHSVVRWRAVHVVGCYPRHESMSLALHLLDRDEDLWVRYGALRSLVEMASKSEGGLRAAVLMEIVARRDQILADVRLRDELVRALQIRPTSTTGNWAASALQVLATYLESSSGIEEIDYWGRGMRAIRSIYAHATS